MPDDYELIDFGAGRKLERFGAITADRPCPAAEAVAKVRPDLWGVAVARYERTSVDEGVWRLAEAIPKQWDVEFSIGAGAAPLRFRLQPSPFGHVGVFPEQHENWKWIAERVAKSQAALGRPPKVLNLFAYTGGSTLAAAAAGAEVVHIDAARNIVDRARENATLSGLADRPIRWIAEDTMKFCRRELKRGNRYDAMILDPPSYGHGSKGEPWKIDDDLLPLLKMCGELTADGRAFVLVTCHTPGIGPAELAAYLSDGIFGHCGTLETRRVSEGARRAMHPPLANASGFQRPPADELFLKTADGRKLPSGVYARWS